MTWPRRCDSLPGEAEKNYLFTSPYGDLSLEDLFKRHRQLPVKLFMMEPGQEWQCQGCSLAVDHTNGLIPHFEHHPSAKNCT
jgi:predicted dithiol-disulfide oxidoreductase (DUF899 family)